ncbi:uncharacterized protein METZ01_LOCUS102160 [marine metagenome]|uniref:Uncharacterized protein n=1 Tax=marine metagenome TaxID=408172 RepID=A0A381W9T0_9ZZZZ
MADTRITALDRIASPASGDFVALVDKSDTTMSVDGSNVKITFGDMTADIQSQLQAIGAASGIFGVPGSWDTVVKATDLDVLRGVGDGRPLASGELGLLKGLTGGTIQSQIAALGGGGQKKNKVLFANESGDIVASPVTSGDLQILFSASAGVPLTSGELGLLKGLTGGTLQSQLTSLGGGGHKAERVLIADGDGETATSPVTSGDLQILFHAAAGVPMTSGELGLLKGLTGGTLQSQLAAKHDTIDASNRLDATLIGANGNVSNTEYGYLSSVASDIQTQLNAVGAASGTFTNIIGDAIANGVTATTQSSSDNSTKVATTAYADAAGGGSARSVAGDTDNGVISWVTSDNTFAAASGLRYDGTDLILTRGEASKPVFTIENSNNGATGGTLKFHKLGAALTHNNLGDSDVIGNVDFASLDDGGNAHTYARILGKIDDVTSGQEEGSLEFYVAEYDGTLTKGMDIVGLGSDGNITVDISTHDGATGGLKLGGTLVTATAAELNAAGGAPTGSGAVSECTGRLTAESAVYVSTTDQTLDSTIYFCGPTGGNFRTWLWTPNKYTEWVYPQISLSMASLTANYPYDIFIHDNSGIPTLSHSVWSSATGRMTAIEMDEAGIIHKNNARTHRYLGTIYLNATGIFQDTIYSRGIWNLYNQRRRTLLAPMTGTYWTYGTATIRASNSNTTLNNMRCDWVQGMSDSEVNLVFRQQCGYSGTGYGWCGIGIDSTSSDSAQINNAFYVSTDSRWATIASEYRGFPGIGYHYGQCLENSPGGVSLYFYGLDGNNYQGGMIGSIMC